jgi:hypothetical protein
MYCSINEAFTTTLPETQRKKKRREGKRPLLPPPEPFAIDPDRPANRPPQEAEVVSGGKEYYTNLLSAVDSDDSYFPHPHTDLPGDDMYKLQPDWTQAFNGPSVPSWVKERLAQKEAEIPLQTPSWMEGGPTLYQKIPSAYTVAAPAPAVQGIDESRLYAVEERLNGRLDQMFSRLDEINKAKSESNHIEIILFILGGLFLLLMLDMLVKQGTKAAIMIASAGGSMLYKGYVP